MTDEGDVRSGEDALKRGPSGVVYRAHVQIIREGDAPEAEFSAQDSLQKDGG